MRRQVEPDEEEEEIQTKPLANQITPLVQRQTEPEDPLQTKQSISQTPRLVPRFGSSIRSMRGNGQALSQSERAFFEPTFGHDFSRVKVHTSPQAAKAAQAINAQAFTLGNDIFFGPGRYMPETSIGKGLLAHELVHVIQQREHDDLISRSMVDDRRKEIVDTALGLTEEHYLMGAAGQIPDKGGGVNARNVIMNSSNHAASIDVDYGKKKGGKKTHVCAGRSEKAASLPQADPKNEEHHNNPSKYKWKRISDGSAVFGEACELKNHFDCGGFISYCYKKVCPEVKYPGDVINLLSASYGWTKVDKEQVQPGDIAYREGQEHGHHAGLCISSDKVISALGKKWGVQSEPTSKYQKFGHLGCLKEQEEKKSGGIHRKELAYKSQPNNMYEQEAEQMADLVMRMPELRVQRQVEPKEREIREKNWRDIKNSIHKKINDHVKLYPELEKFRNDLRKILETIAAKYLDPSHMSSQEKAGIWALRQLDVKEWTYESTSPSRGTAEIGKEYKCNKFIADAFGFGAGLGYGTQKGYPTKLHERLLGLYKRIYPYVANELADPKGQIANFPVIAYKDYTEKSPKDIDMNKLKFGDVVAFYNPNYKKKKQLPGHCGIYLGSGLYISAGATKGGYIELVANQEPPKRKDHSITTYRRYTPR